MLGISNRVYVVAAMAVVNHVGTRARHMSLSQLAQLEKNSKLKQVPCLVTIGAILGMSFTFDGGADLPKAMFIPEVESPEFEVPVRMI